MGRFSLLIFAFLLSGCVFDGMFTPSPAPVAGTVTQTVFKYSPEFQHKAAQELSAVDMALGYQKPAQAPPCSRQVPSKDCSAVRAMVTDYKYDRDQGRRLGAIEVP
jgi:hypothetical protein